MNVVCGRAQRPARHTRALARPRQAWALRDRPRATPPRATALSACAHSSRTMKTCTMYKITYVTKKKKVILVWVPRY